MNQQEFYQWRSTYIADKQSAEASLQWRPPLVVGILNLTPDSFSDGGHYLEKDRAIERAIQMVEEGADLIDIGGESSRPGALPISVEEELFRVIPIIEKIVAKTDICLSIDTVKPKVMQEAIGAGAGMINDILALRSEEALHVAASLNVPVCLMHMAGKPTHMQDAPVYAEDVLNVINNFFERSIKRSLDAGISFKNLILDPGFGFGKSISHNLRLVNQCHQFQMHRLPVMLGVSRKSTLGEVLGKPVNQRQIGGLTAGIYASMQGAAMIRTHDVEETVQAFSLLKAIHQESSQCTLTQGTGI